MAANFLKGLGQGLFAAAGTVNQGMMGDIQDKRQKEAEARREASIEKRWQAESAARKAERAEDQRFRKAERDADRAENKAWRDAQIQDRKEDRADQAQFRADQLSLNTRKSLSDDISKVDQQTMVGLSRINERYARAALKLQEQGLMGTALSDAIGILEKQMKDEVAQFATQADVRRQQVAEIYGEEGLQYVKGMNYTSDFGLGKDVDVGKIVEDAKKPKPKLDASGKPVPTVSTDGTDLEETPSFDAATMFDTTRRAVSGQIPGDEARDYAWELWNRPKSPVDTVGGFVGSVGGTLTGLGQRGAEKVTGLYDWAVTKK